MKKKAAVRHQFNVCAEASPELSKRARHQRYAVPALAALREHMKGKGYKPRDYKRIPLPPGEGFSVKRYTRDRIRILELYIVPINSLYDPFYGIRVDVGV